MFNWSARTLCGHTLYFTISDSWDVFINVVIGFDTITKQIIEIPFPPVPPTPIYQGVLVNVQNLLHMLLITIRRETKRSAGL
ncbi:hypothetical protein Hanom_Chr08g00727981 [Helianthus anomalus]